MGKTAISAPAAGAHPRAGDRAPGLFGRAWRKLSCWRERVRQRRELAALSKHELADLGIPPGLAAYEAGRWPWQTVSPEWRELELDRTRREMPPLELFSAGPDRDRTARPAWAQRRV